MTTILYGAGASYGFFNIDPSSQYLTSKIKNVNVWQDALIRYHNKNLPSAQDIVKVIERICIADDKYNFEQICEVLDKFCSYHYDKLPKDTYLANIILTLCNGFLPTQFNWVDVPYVYRQILANTLVELHTTHKMPDYVNSISQQTAFLDFVCQIEEDKPVSIVSFNYDDIVLE